MIGLLYPGVVLHELAHYLGYILFGEWNAKMHFYKNGEAERDGQVDGIFKSFVVCFAPLAWIPVFLVLGVYVSFFFWIYLGLWIFTPKDKRAPYRREHRQARRARRENPENPVATASFNDVKGKFRSLETRLQDMEKSITSSEWQLRREFRDLES